MLTLITYPETFGQASASPFCVKAIYLLNLSGQTWAREDTKDPRKAPRAKLPVLRTPDGVIHDSDNIRAYLEQQGHDFDAGLTPQEKAIGRALQRMMEEHTYFIQALDRWENDSVWPVVRDAYFDEVPRLIRGFVTASLRKTLMKGMHAQGLGRLTWDERLEKVDVDLATVATMIGDKPFLFGDTPTAADACVAPVLSGLRATPGGSYLSKRISQNTALNAYVDRAEASMGTT